MSSREFTGWLAFDRLVPLDLSERLIASLLTVTANVHRDKKRTARPYTLETFMPDPHAPPPLSPAEQAAAVRAALRELEESRKARA